MKTFNVVEVHWDLDLLYKQAGLTKARRGLFGYMLHTERMRDGVFGGAFRLLMEMENLGKNECYRLVSQSGVPCHDIVAITEAALAGGFSRFAVPAREIRRVSVAMEELNLRVREVE